MQQDIYNIQDISKASSEVKLNPEVCGLEMNNDLVWQIVNSIRYQRITTKDTKNRSEARGGGKKPWRQKGTGRARAGTSRSPIWVGGGITFNHKSRVCSHKIPKQMYRKAIAVIISEIKRQDKLVIVEDMKLDTHKTKDLVHKLAPWIAQRKILMLTDAIDPNFMLASRNLFEIYYGQWQSTVCPDVLTNSNLLVVTKQAMQEIEEWLK